MGREVDIKYVNRGLVKSDRYSLDFKSSIGYIGSVNWGEANRIMDEEEKTAPPPVRGVSVLPAGSIPREGDIGGGRLQLSLLNSCNLNREGV